MGMSPRKAASKFNLSRGKINGNLATLFTILFVFSFILILTINHAIMESVAGTRTLFGTDWWRHLRPGTLELLAGRTPYTVPGVFNPPWLFVLLIPIAILPEKLGIVIMFVLFSVGTLLVAHRLGASWKTLLMFTLSPVIWRGAIIANIDWLVGVGFLLPPQIGLFFVLIKPQIGLAVALYWFVEAFRKGGWKEIVRVFSPVVAGFLLSFLVFGFWPLQASAYPPEGMNVSTYPYGLLVGAGLLTFAIHKRSFPLAILASPFFSPYVGVTSLIFPFLALVTLPWEMLAVTIALWIVLILQIAGLG